jgi:16S rRNA (guanine966-N2)-methyltransferase
MGLRIIGGRWKGRLLLVPQHRGIRPTSSKVRKAVFDICQHLIEGAHVLDLYAGTGAIGIEALSRGAQSVSFIESDPRSIRSLLYNIKKMTSQAWASQCRVLHGDVLLRLRELEGVYNFIYIDPPYGCLDLKKLMQCIEERQYLAQGGVLFIEDLASSHFAFQGVSLKHYRTYHYGKTTLSQYLRE